MPVLMSASSAVHIDHRRLPVGGLVAAAVVSLLLCAMADFAAAETATAPEVQVEVPAGFRATLYADDHLAHDVFSMTTNSQGQLVVSGPGYVRVLIDEDADGVADSYRQFANGPKSGAQGMCFHRSDLLCLGDEGLLRFRDRNGDSRADGPAEVFLRIACGSEHHAHAIRQGPDGWWYVIAGNASNITSAYATRKTSPVLKPSAGALLRLSPDLSAGEILADGFRNAYDFDFLPDGDILAWDSDGERDVSLPWYRPTRVFQVVPGGSAGWMSRSWKRPGSFFDMLPVLSRLGRGSPTGVVCYRHRAFPEKYQGAVFVLDWTFGRVAVVFPEASGAGWKASDELFMSGAGQHGFAPTDGVVGPDGALYLSVGGRGTRGGVYRVEYIGGAVTGGRGGVASAETTLQPAGGSSDDEQALAACLRAPQPLSAWSRAIWRPAARRLGQRAIEVAAADEDRPVVERTRAIEILLELFDGPGLSTLARLAGDSSPAVRAKIAWARGRMRPAVADARMWWRLLRDRNPVVVRMTLESLAGIDRELRESELYQPLASALGHADPAVRRAAARVMNRLSPLARRGVLDAASREGMRAELTARLGMVLRAERAAPEHLAFGLRALEQAASPVDAQDAVRLLQLALGDVGPFKSRAPVFDGYAPAVDLESVERELDDARAGVAELYPTGNRQTDHELVRLLSMLAPPNRGLLTKLLIETTAASHPVDDIHRLLAVSRLPLELTHAQRGRVARVLLRLDHKLQERELPQDTNWEPRVRELYQQLVQQTPALPETIVRLPEFGRAGHVLFLSELPEPLLPLAIEGFARRIDEEGDDYDWSSQVVFVLGRSDKPEHRELVREQLDEFALQDAALIVLAKTPEAQDRVALVRGLESSQLEVLTACLEALEQLGRPASDDRIDIELTALFRLVRQLGRDAGEIPLRDRAARLLQSWTGQQFGYREKLPAGELQAGVMNRWASWLTATYPERGTEINGSSQEVLDDLFSRLESIDWTTGNARRGQVLFEKKACSRCHGGRQALGPDLAGVAARFSRRDLFTAIAVPDRDVSPRYQTTLIVTDRGRTVTGLVIYNSVDGVTLRTGQNETIRLEDSEIDQRRTLRSSLMPQGLLKGLTDNDLADLDAYLRSLRR